MIRDVITNGAYKLVRDGTEIRIYHNDKLSASALVGKRLRGSQLIDILNGFIEGETLEDRIKKWKGSVQE